MKMTRIYTRRGDDGMTDLVGGVRISKADKRIEAYGTIDELSSHLGLLAAMLTDAPADRENIIHVQDNLFRVGTHLATDQSQTPLYASALLPEGATQQLEQLIDQAKDALPQAQGFVLPGGCMAAAQCHVCRTVCRRAERRIADLATTATVGPDIVKYVNRLSDYLFILAKKINFNSGHPEILWEKPCK